MSNLETSSSIGIQYNQRTYYIDACLYYKVEGKTEIYYRLDRQSILEFKLIKDINTFFYRSIIKIKDFSNLIALNVKTDGNWYFYLKVLSTWGQAEDNFAELASEKERTIEYNFIIYDINVINFSQTATTIELYSIEPFSQNFLKPVAFSSQSDLDQCEVLKQLLLASGIDSTKLPNTIEKCGTTENYITDNNHSLQYHVDYFLNKIYSPSNGFLYLYYDTPQEKFIESWIYKKFFEAEQTPIEKISYNYIKINSPDRPVKGDDVAVGFLFYNYINFNDKSQFIVDTKINNFNYEKSTVETQNNKNYNYNWFENFISSDIKNTYLYLPNNILKYGKDSKLLKNPGIYYRNSNEDIFLKTLKFYYLKANTICVKTLGVIWRKIGEIYYLDFSQAGITSKLNGNWYCTKIVDEFQNNTHYQYIFLTRFSDNFKSQDISNALLNLKIDTSKPDYLQ